MYSADEISSALDYVSAQPTKFDRPDGVIRPAVEIQQVQTRVAEIALADPDVVLHGIALAKTRIAEATGAMRRHLGTLSELLAEASLHVKPPAPALNTDALGAATSHLRLLRTRQNIAARARSGRAFSEAVNQVVDSLDVVRGGDVVRSSRELVDSALAPLEELSRLWDVLVVLQDGLEEEVTGFQESDVLVQALSEQASRGEEVLGTLRGSPQVARAEALRLLALKGLIAQKLDVPDPLTAKYEGTLAASGTSTKATHINTVTIDEGTVHGVLPLRLAAPQTLGLKVDGVAVDWELPASLPPVFAIPAWETVEIVEDKGAFLLAPSAGTYVLLRAALVESAFVAADGVTVTYLSGFPGSVQAGDVIWLNAGARRIQVVLDGVVLLEEAIPGGLYTNPNVMVDNRLLITVNGGELQSVEYPVTVNDPSEYEAIEAAALMAAFLGEIDGVFPTIEGGAIKFIVGDPIGGAEVGSGVSIAIQANGFAQALGWEAGSHPADYGADGNNELKFQVPSGEVAIPLTPNPVATPTDVANDIIAEGTLGAVVDGDLLVQGETLGDRAWLSPVEAKGNNTLGVYLGTFWGEHVTAEHLRSSFEASEVPCTLDLPVETRAVPGTASIEEGALSTLVFSSSVEAILELGDTIELLGDPQRGTYWVLGVSGAAVTLDASLPAGEYRVRAFRQTVKLTSTNTTVASAIEVTSVVEEIGFPLGESRGTVTQLTADTNLEEVIPQIHPQDLVQVSGQECIVKGLSGTMVSIVEPVPNNTGGIGTIDPLGAVRFTGIPEALATWRETRAASSFPGDLLTFVRHLGEALLSSRPTGDVIAQVTEFGDLLDSLEATLASYDAVMTTELATAITELRGGGLDRAASLLSAGRLSQFFALSAEEASHREKLLSTIATTGGEFPLSESYDGEDPQPYDGSQWDANLDADEREELDDPSGLTELPDDGEELEVY